MMLKRLLYLAYYFKEIDRTKLNRFVEYAHAVHPRERFRTFSLWRDILGSSLRYNISVLDYFYFRFFEIDDPVKRRTFAGTGFLYEYQLKMNPLKKREVLEDKILFLKRYQPFVQRKFLPLNGVTNETVTEILNNPSGKLVVKGSKGQVGAEVQVLNASDFTSDSLVRYMIGHRFDLMEEYVVQHSQLMELSPSGLNTIRIFTQIEGKELTILGARLRITINSSVDNMAAGNIAAPIDIATGIVFGPGVFSDITKDDVEVHPITGVSVSGFQVPFWKETLAMMQEIAFHAPENRSVGWDIAISEKGPEVIEGNHNWCKLLWQLPVKKGLKAELMEFL